MPLTESVNLVLANGQPVPVDLYRSNVSLLLHGDGTNGSTTIIDSSPNAFNFSSRTAVTISTTSPKYGSGSLAFDGTTSNLFYPPSSVFAFGNGDFTIELWLKSTNTSSFNIVSCINGANVTGNWGLIATATTVNWQDAGYWNNLYTRPVSDLLNGQWHHIAVCRSGTSNRMFFDGIQQGATVSDNTNYIGTADTSIGGPAYGALNGYIDDLRITKGVARYTSNFTPPTAPFPDI